MEDSAPARVQYVINPRHWPRQASRPDEGEPSVPKFLDKILRAGEGRTLKKLEGIAKQVNLLEETVSDLSDSELRAQTDLFKKRLAEGETLDDILPEAFATVREAAKRTLGQRPYDVQLMGGAALHMGNIAEMKTGEGKTLVATLPSYLNALTGKGVHVVTVNDYLASYQSELMGRVHRFLGLTTGCILTGQTPEQRRKEYAADITYGTNNEFGFDYLRDNMAWKVEDLVQREHNFVIIDEVDSILIDEARTPLIISGPAEGDANKWYMEFARVAARMRRDTDYEVDEKKRTVGILEPGIDRVEDLLGIDNLYESLNTPLIGYLNNAIKAKELFERDKDYIVQKGEVLIVDEHTGRVLPGRRYNEGMHQAIEAKEGVHIKAENQTLATITLQNYFRLYDKISGMTGTAETEAEEFASTYKLGVVPIPTNKPMIRKDNIDLVYPTRAGKLRAIVEDIKERNEAGQPVLVGTTSVEKSEELSHLLDRAGISHQVLNAKQHEREAAVVAEAGRKGAVTVATNMAGRGTDIMLGGNPEHRAVDALRARGLDPEETPEEYEAAWPEALQAAKDAVAEEHDEVVALGGLYVLGSERHESRRIDNQLRGRSGRQGDPGESRFYLALEDDLMRLFASGIAARALDPSRYPEDQPLEFKMVAKSIERAQVSIESRNAEIRKNVLKYDDVMSEQRSVVYTERRRILDGEDLENMIQGFLDFEIQDIVASHTDAAAADDWDLDGLWNELKTFYQPGFSAKELVDEAGGYQRLDRGELISELSTDIHAHYSEREAEVGEDAMRELERQILLNVLDRKWREHLYEMDYLKEGIGLRAMAQRDPLVEYKSEGYQMFQAMNDGIKEDTVRFLFNFELPSERAARMMSEAKDAEAAAAAAAAQQATVAEQQAHAARMAAAGSKNRVDAEKVLGIKTPARNTAVSYSSAAKDGSGDAQTTNAAGRQVRKPASGASDGMNREQRRAAKRKK
ncbi:preprotein translocase subunit SecA [Arcanobacterium haemolyticum]|nr:preprotein translocase subunit SecA [Arcanobacterium haemolyticum]